MTNYEHWFEPLKLETEEQVITFIEALEKAEEYAKNNPKKIDVSKFKMVTDPKEIKDIFKF